MDGNTNSSSIGNMDKLDSSLVLNTTETMACLKQRQAWCPPALHRLNFVMQTIKKKSEGCKLHIRNYEKLYQEIQDRFGGWYGWSPVSFLWVSREQEDSCQSNSYSDMAETSRDAVEYRNNTYVNERTVTNYQVSNSNTYWESIRYTKPVTIYQNLITTTADFKKGRNGWSEPSDEADRNDRNHQNDQRNRYDGSATDSRSVFYQPISVLYRIESSGYFAQTRAEAKMTGAERMNMEAVVRSEKTFDSLRNLHRIHETDHISEAENHKEKIMDNKLNHDLIKAAGEKQVTAEHIGMNLEPSHNNSWNTLSVEEFDRIYESSRLSFAYPQMKEEAFLHTKSEMKTIKGASITNGYDFERSFDTAGDGANVKITDRNTVNTFTSVPVRNDTSVQNRSLPDRREEFDIHHLSDRVYRSIQDKQQSEKERRGYY